MTCKPARPGGADWIAAMPDPLTRLKARGSLSPHQYRAAIRYRTDYVQLQAGYIGRAAPERLASVEDAAATLVASAQNLTAAQEALTGLSSVHRRLVDRVVLDEVVPARAISDASGGQGTARDAIRTLRQGLDLLAQMYHARDTQRAIDLAAVAGRMMTENPRIAAIATGKTRPRARTKRVAVLKPTGKIV